MNNYLSDEEYDFIYSRVPRVTVDLLIKNREDQILLTQRTIEPYINHWHLPGGRIKFRESVGDAIKRIAKTELGIELKFVGKIVGICEYPDEYQHDQPRHSISIVYGFVVSGLSEMNAQDKYVWCSKIPDPIIPPVKEFLISNRII